MAEIRILDGGMSRELVRLGAELRQPEWSASALWEAPAKVRQVHEEFIDAGAGMITTNSYALVPFHIGEDRFREEGASLIALSGRLAREAAASRPGRDVIVAGSLPPIFGSYEPQLFDAARVQLRAAGKNEVAFENGVDRQGLDQGVHGKPPILPERASPTRAATTDQARPAPVPAPGR